MKRKRQIRNKKNKYPMKMIGAKNWKNRNEVRILYPAIDIKELEDMYLLYMEIPDGVSEDIDASIWNNKLRIKKILKSKIGNNMSRSVEMFRHVSFENKVHKNLSIKKHSGKSLLIEVRKVDVPLIAKVKREN